MGRSTPGRAGPPGCSIPIDGTVNFVYGIEAYAVSVGVQVDGASVAGAVANVPTGEVFSAAVGQGARLQRGDTSIPLRCNAIRDLSMALVGTGFGYAPERRRGQAEVLTRLISDVRDVRRIGSCALDLCMVAAGRLDAYYEGGVHVWDWAAGALVAAEAGRGCGCRRATTTSSSSLRRPASPTSSTQRCGVWVPRRRVAEPATRVSRRRRGSSAGAPRPAGCVASGRRLASTASMSSLWLSWLNSVPIAKSTVSSLLWSWYSSVQGATSHTAAAAARPDGPNRSWPWHWSRVFA